MTLFIFFELYLWIGRGERREPPEPARLAGARPAPPAGGDGPAPSPAREAAEAVRTLA